MFDKALKRLTFLPLAAALFTAPVLAQDNAEETDPVVATVNGVELRVSDVIESARDLPAEYQTQMQTLFPALVQRLIDFTLLDLAAQEEDLADDDEVLERTATLKQEVMRDVLLEREITDRVTDEALQSAYQDFLEANPPQTEVRARHILLESEEEAKDVIGKLDEGSSFEELAKEFSTGPTGPNGGDLGYFVEGQMVQPFSDAAFALEPGSYTAEPVETQFGWHVILVEDKREQAPPAFEEVQNQLIEQQSRQAVEEYLVELREGAEVVISVDEAEAQANPEAAAEEGEASESEEPSGN